ncbi:hypothetical protein AKG95_21825 [Janthinobacterium lividum]|uniref:Uncharacterized protein n=1 Tax=Janthinobacterium lividum TaxID=29581 RepID=A0A1S1U467_9BURK|nr:hypothetical protein [Janthinobacterium lividum]OHV94938.1 hypothetical protein AKG95_21825 [Janthinobacterium lividum]
MKIFLIFFAAMSLASLLSNFTCHLHSNQFLDHARHPDHPTAFQRRRKLPLPALVALMLTGMRKSVQTELDEFFAHLRQQAQLVHAVSAQAFAQARAKLAATAMPELSGSSMKLLNVATGRVVKAVGGDRVQDRCSMVLGPFQISGGTERGPGPPFVHGLSG